MNKILFIISLLSNVLQYQKNKHNRGGKNGGEEADRVRDKVLPPDTINIKWHEDEHKRQDRLERFSWSKDSPVWFGTLLAFAAFIISVLAFNEAQETTKEISRQANIAQQQLVLGARAFVFPRSIKFNPRIGRIGVEWEDSASTPPVNLLTAVYCGPSQIDVSPPFEKLYTNINPVKTILGPHESKVAGRCTISPGDIDKYTRGEHFIYIGGQALYLDVFGNAHVTQFCYEYEWSGVPISGKEGDAREILGDPILCWKHNCTDDECHSN